jgi:cytochrome P450
MARTVVEYFAARGKSLGATKDDTPIGVKPKTIFHAIDNSSLPLEEKSTLRMVQEGFNALVAGGETTSRILAHTVYHLLEKPEIYQKIRDEIMTVTDDSNQLPGIKVLEALPWLVRRIFLRMLIDSKG